MQQSFLLLHFLDGFLDPIVRQGIKSLFQNVTVPRYFLVEVIALVAHAPSLSSPLEKSAR
jgi:hypothetical protein